MDSYIASIQWPTCSHEDTGPCSHWKELCDRARRHLTLHALYINYWQLRHETPLPDVSSAYTELLAVAVEIYSIIAGYQRRGGYHERTQDDPAAFWMFAQPHEEIAKEAGPGIIDVYVDIITDADFLHSPPVRL